MRANLINLKDRRQLESILLVCVLVATSIVILVPLTAPKAEAVIHLGSASLEDGDIAYDTDATVNGIVHWSDLEDHIIDDPFGYTIEADMTLDIPNLNWQLGNPAENVIEFVGGIRIDVEGTLITHSGPLFKQWTCFTGSGFGGWQGIFFHNGSKGVIRDVRVNNSQTGIVWEPGSTILSGGIDGSRFENVGQFGMTMNGVTGATDITDTSFYSYGAIPPSTNGIGLDVRDGELNITGGSFNSHGPGLQSLHIADATVKIDGVTFEGYNQPGTSIFVEGSASDDTEIHNSDFSLGVTGNHYIQTDGASILINSSTFDTTGGQLTVVANDFGNPANAILRNPNPPGTTFDNTTMDVTGGSSIALQWFKDVYAVSPDSNLIFNAPVRIKDRLGNPASPSVKQTDATGWARWIICTELIKYAGSVDNFNPFNISAENNSMLGYAMPEETMDMSKVNTIIVPDNPIANTPPSVLSLDLVPSGAQSGLVTITFELGDPDAADNGNLSVDVDFYTPGLGWFSCVLDPIGDLLIDLSVSTLYTVYWVSNDPSQLPNTYSTEVKIRITPYDKGGPGTPTEIGPFTLDNRAPDFMTSPPMWDVFDTNAWINWTTDENAEARVWYGLTLLNTKLNPPVPPPVLTTEVTGNSGSSSQSVQLTGLQTGRNYTFVINSTDPEGNKRSSITDIWPFQYFQFTTQIRIQLTKGWNMVSIPPYSMGLDIADTLTSIAGQYDAVQTYDPLDPDPWKHYRTGAKPANLNDLLNVNVLQGFWVHMINDDMLITSHMDPTTDNMSLGYTTINLVAGWNYVGYPSVVNRGIVPALAGVTYDIVWAFDGTQWEYYDGAGTLAQMESGKGYWIHCPFPDTWDVDYV